MRSEWRRRRPVHVACCCVVPGPGYDDVLEPYLLLVGWQQRGARGAEPPRSQLCVGLCWFSANISLPRAPAQTTGVRLLALHRLRRLHATLDTTFDAITSTRRKSTISYLLLLIIATEPNILIISILSFVNGPLSAKYTRLPLFATFSPTVRRM